MYKTMNIEQRSLWTLHNGLLSFRCPLYYPKYHLHFNFEWAERARWKSI